MKKILALHGLGSSSSMLKEQLAPFIRELGSGYHFEFLEGAVPCGRGPGVPSWASGPFYSYATGFSPAEMREALFRIDDFVIEHGPFDGILGFSLGAAVVVSYLLDQRRQEASTPFRFAVLFSTIFITSPDDTYCEQLLLRWQADDRAEFRSQFPDGDFAALLDPGPELQLAEYLQLVLSMQTLGVGSILPSFSSSSIDFLAAGRLDVMPRLVHPDLLPERVEIPTVHVTGLGDFPFIRAQSDVARRLCAQTQQTFVHKHGGGHHLPLERPDVKAIVRSIKAVAELET